MQLASLQKYKIIAISAKLTTFATIFMDYKAVMKITFATGNSGKLREAKEILGGGFELVTPAQLGLTEDIEETGTTFKANSLLKARYIVDHFGGNCFADDSGLEVEILAGRPGIYSARYAGLEHDFAANMDKLLADMACREIEASRAREYGINTVHATRRANFSTVVTLILEGKEYFFEGRLDGRIGLVRKGNGGFGYDPLFIPDMIPAEALPPMPERFRPEPDAEGLVPNVMCLTTAELGEDVKNAISHRGKAMRAMADFLKSL